MKINGPDVQNFHGTFFFLNVKKTIQPYLCLNLMQNRCLPLFTAVVIARQPGASHQVLEPRRVTQVNLVHYTFELG